MLSPARDVVVLFDVDNTLLDNDRFSDDLDAHLVATLGVAGQQRYRLLYAAHRAEAGYADYLAPLQHLRDDFVADPDLLQLSGFLLDYPFADRVYPGALDCIAALRGIARAVILSDGDVVFQPRKIQRAGLWDAVQGRVHVYLHKEHMLDAVQQAYPADHYVMVDDKPGLLARIKQALGSRVTTVFVRQGHYATVDALAAAALPPDVAIGHIAAFRDTFAGIDMPAREAG
jgi:FMN phosphatase YigB (HAD superfamily)